MSGYGLGRNFTFLGRVCGMCVWACVSAVPRHSWSGYVVCGPARVLLEARVSWLVGVCRLVFPPPPSWGMSLSCVGWVVPRRSWRRVLSGAVVPHRSWWRALWLSVPAPLGGCRRLSWGGY